jgi:hypothetical protein
MALQWWALILVLLGLLSGFMPPLADMASRTAYTISALVLPFIAKTLDAILAVGAHLNAMIDNFAVIIAGMVIANFLLVIVSQLTASNSSAEAS